MNSMALKSEFITFKSHARDEFRNSSFKDFWGMIIFSNPLKCKYINISIIAYIAKVQYECVFSIQILIKKKSRYILTTKIWMIFSI